MKAAAGLCTGNSNREDDDEHEEEFPISEFRFNCPDFAACRKAAIRKHGLHLVGNSKVKVARRPQSGEVLGPLNDTFCVAVWDPRGSRLSSNLKWFGPSRIRTYDQGIMSTSGRFCIVFQRCSIARLHRKMAFRTISCRFIFMRKNDRWV